MTFLGWVWVGVIECDLFWPGVGECTVYNYVIASHDALSFLIFHPSV